MAVSEIGASMSLMAILADRILDRSTPLDDDILVRRLGVGHRQAVNQAAPVWRLRVVSGDSPGLMGRLSTRSRTARRQKGSVNVWRAVVRLDRIHLHRDSAH